ncbi:septal ring lytic transglycosylase RlpA family protein [Lysobacter sp. HDW10]|uniref:septal ring lytic transglycosylase RlpA family protein n=1 Tax=Lysobacter sp. HDW10 TaxID=2714936 RepID=UPI00140E00A7|nr:septal ring lytic transglycosylase RlpA family protein [Lysobacter sp. HDW10]QIK81049.1 septal ring lytic transglycosylase RlpA family protein [Lysobacter sp. HDW10]
MRWLVACSVVLLAACSTAPKKNDTAGSKVGESKHTPTHKPVASSKGKTSPYAPAAEDPSKRGNYVAGGLYAPNEKDSVPDEIPDVDAIPEPVVKNEPRSRSGNKDYTVLGKRYRVLDDHEGYDETGNASYYGKKFHGRKTSNGDIYDMYAFTAAHRSLPLPSYARVTNLDNGKSVIVRVNDRGPFHSNRIIDLSYAAAVKLDYRRQGTARVRVEALSPEDADDTDAVLAKAKAARKDPEARKALASEIASDNKPEGIALQNSVAAGKGEYRFDMKQNGRPMTADEFDRWLAARRVRIATGKPGKPDKAVTTMPEATPPRVTKALAPEVPSTTAPKHVDSTHTLQVASFASQQNAEHALDVLKSAGIQNSRLVAAQVNGKQVWRLRVGPVAEGDAAKLSSSIAGLGFGQPAIVRD